MRILILLVVISLCQPVLAWWDSGHRVVAEIAERRMNETTRAEVQRMLEHHPDPQVRTLEAASLWPDVIKERSHPFHHHDRPDWHYQGRALKGRVAPKEGALALELPHQVAILKDPGASLPERAVALCWVVHLVGDIHQPLHVGTLYSERFPRGDRGGIDTIVWLGDQQLNLHQVWDSAGCRFLRPISESRFQAYITSCLATVADPSPESEPEAWMEEGLEICHREVYVEMEPETRLASDYLRRAQHTTRQRLALSGLRLARLLDASIEVR